MTESDDRLSRLLRTPSAPETDEAFVEAVRLRVRRSRWTAYAAQGLWAAALLAGAGLLWLAVRTLTPVFADVTLPGGKIYGAPVPVLVVLVLGILVCRRRLLRLI